MNKITGKISQIESDDLLSILSVATEIGNFYVVLLETPQTVEYLRKGKEINLLFKETEVDIFKNCSFLEGKILNLFNGTVTEIENGKVLSKVVIKARNIIFRSIIPKKSVELLDLKPSDNISFSIKPNEITIEVS
ncbi:TOBE domain-containing protein [Persephonella sp.]